MDVKSHRAKVQTAELAGVVAERMALFELESVRLAGGQNLWAFRPGSEVPDHRWEKDRVTRRANVVGQSFPAVPNRAANNTPFELIQPE